MTKWSDLIGLALFLAGKLQYFEEEGKMDAFCGSTMNHEYYYYGDFPAMSGILSFTAFY